MSIYTLTRQINSCCRNVTLGVKPADLRGEEMKTDRGPRSFKQSSYYFNETSQLTSGPEGASTL